MTARSTQVVLDGDSERLRRRLGPTAWSAFEHLVLRSQTDASGALVAHVTARSVAIAVSVGKDTAATALRRLVVDGLVERVGQDRSGGRFATGGYQVHLPPGVRRQESSVPADPRPRGRRTRKPAPQNAATTEQLALLPAPEAEPR